MIAIVNYGMGNLRSVQKAFERLNVPAKIISGPAELSAAEKIILPGVGHFANGMKKLHETGLEDAIKMAVIEKNTPILGICLGMQLMTRHSEEGDVDGLGLVDAITRRFMNLPKGLKIPHMGWNSINPSKESVLINGLVPDDLVYFVHSYFVQCNDQNDRLLSTNYGIRFDSGFQREHIAGFQFHPEKSYRAGLQLLKNFVEL